MNTNYHNTVLEYPSGKPFEEFWVITAWNPRGETNHSLEENLLADQRLQEVLDDMHIERFPVIGKAPDDSHAEPGWGIRCDESTAMRIAREFEQEAVFYLSNKERRIMSILSK